MTVAELIEALSCIENKELIVRAEGCDCINPVAAVSTTIAADGSESDVVIGVDL